MVNDSGRKAKPSTSGKGQPSGDEARAAAAETVSSAGERALTAEQDIAALEEEFKGLELDGLVLQHFDPWRDAGERLRPSRGAAESCVLTRRHKNCSQVSDCAHTRAMPHRGCRARFK
jgi:hypothetical protein